MIVTVPGIDSGACDMEASNANDCFTAAPWPVLQNYFTTSLKENFWGTVQQKDMLSCCWLRN